MLRRIISAPVLLSLSAVVLCAQDKPVTPKAQAPRIVIVVDAESEEPLAGAEVRDLITRNSMRTSPEGAVGLFVPGFVRRDGALLEIRMAGYRPSERMFVDPQVDTAIVVALLKLDAALPAASSDSAPRAPARQRTDSTVFQFVVLDEAAMPLPNATIAIVHGVSTVLATRVTDETGYRTLVLRHVTGEVQISVQRVGYAPYKQFYRLGASDTVVAQVAMRRLAQVLATQEVVAKGNLKRRLYHLDAVDIDTSSRQVKNGLDVVRWLRPEMFGYRLRGLEGCGTANVIWVNGRRIVFAPQSVSIPMLWRPPPVPSSTRGPGGRGRVVYRRPAPPSGEAAATDLVRGVLASIKPEHIAEMTYLDCFDATFARLHTNNGIFVVLKPGVGYDDNRGSVVEPDTARFR